MKPIYFISLNDYLNVCVIYYKAAFGEKTGNMAPEDIYRR